MIDTHDILKDIVAQLNPESYEYVPDYMCGWICKMRVRCFNGYGYKEGQIAVAVSRDKLVVSAESPIDRKGSSYSKLETSFELADPNCFLNLKNFIRCNEAYVNSIEYLARKADPSPLQRFNLANM